MKTTEEENINIGLYQHIIGYDNVKRSFNNRHDKAK